jgi:hypothetical protein
MKVPAVTARANRRVRDRPEAEVVGAVALRWRCGVCPTSMVDDERRCLRTDRADRIDMGEFLCARTLLHVRLLTPPVSGVQPRFTTFERWVCVSSSWLSAPLHRRGANPLSPEGFISLEW